MDVWFIVCSFVAHRETVLLVAELNAAFHSLEYPGKEDALEEKLQLINVQIPWGTRTGITVTTNNCSTTLNRALRK
jgi:hypothetical protein